MKQYIQNFFKGLLHHIDVSRHLAHHLVGPNHTTTHRRNIGIGVMSIGILLMKITFFQHCLIANFFQDFIGASMHGIGLIPFIKEIEKVEQNL